ncbi:hypothetical protein BV22DRAFT_1050801 [Leucogyrophana mollusca]|uniref:Uncharacterized protein n=1 Tax=Leucogyrophana mollusca TaxID=85980 RepID=A0ACB8B3H6_9AGAM|nr:hypothetical protein BV22DRAFT_1050801 [Leucogyrophana mollusca]
MLTLLIDALISEVYDISGRWTCTRYRSLTTQSEHLSSGHTLHDARDKLDPRDGFIRVIQRRHTHSQNLRIFAQPNEALQTDQEREENNGAVYGPSVLYEGCVTASRASRQLGLALVANPLALVHAPTRQKTNSWLSVLALGTVA